LQDWENAVKQSGMTDIKIVLYLLNPEVAPASTRAVQNNINDDAKLTAQNIGGFGTSWRQSMADPAPGGEMMILGDGTITVAEEIPP